MAASRAVMPPWMPSRRTALSNTCGACWFVMVRCRPVIGAWLTSSVGPQPSWTPSATPSTANPASPWLFPGQLAGEHRSYRRLIVILSRLGIPARASRLAAWHQLVRQAPPAVLADALGVSPGHSHPPRASRGADWAAYASRRSSLATPEYDGLPLRLPAQAGFRSPRASAGPLRHGAAARPGARGLSRARPAPSRCGLGDPAAPPPSLPPPAAPSLE
jgi:hypothetical protein